MVATGRVLQFDESRGYGFIAADDGGDDVFLHASVIEQNDGPIKAGARVEYEVLAGDRGRKAYAARVLDGCGTPSARPAPPEVLGPGPASPADEEETCDVLSSAEFTDEATELLLSAEPSLTGTQIVSIRSALLEFATKRGWVDS